MFADRSFLDGWTENRGPVTSGGGGGNIRCSHSDQVRENVKTSGVRLEPDLPTAIDDRLDRRRQSGEDGAPFW